MPFILSRVISSFHKTLTLDFCFTSLLIVFCLIIFLMKVGQMMCVCVCAYKCECWGGGTDLSKDILLQHIYFCMRRSNEMLKS